jgi:hypothetical protein
MSVGAQIGCSRCGARFVCDPAGDCWCKALPRLPMPPAGETCLCPDCLRKALEAAARAQPDTPTVS